jgi:hypothetical protein
MGVEVWNSLLYLKLYNLSHAHGLPGDGLRMATGDTVETTVVSLQTTGVQKCMQGAYPRVTLF